MLLFLRLLLAIYASGLILAGILLGLNIVCHAYQWLIEYPYKEGRWQAGMALLLSCVAAPLVLAGSWFSVRYLLPYTRRLCTEVLQSLSLGLGTSSSGILEPTELPTTDARLTTHVSSSSPPVSSTSSSMSAGIDGTSLPFELDEDGSSKIRAHITAHISRRTKLRELASQGIVIPRDIAENLDMDLDQYLSQHFPPK